MPTCAYSKPDWDTVMSKDSAFTEHTFWRGTDDTRFLKGVNTSACGDRGPLGGWKVRGGLQEEETSRL